MQPAYFTDCEPEKYATNNCEYYDLIKLENMFFVEMNEL